MIDLVIKQRIILAHIDGMSNRAIANLLHLSKDTVNKYVNEYNEKREELLRMHSDMDTAETIRTILIVLICKRVHFLCYMALSTKRYPSDLFSCLIASLIKF